ncbi:MAG: oligoendopeptidase F [Clostridia bacterium]|nr:oligoendopeptidase F [Clostridia bacterium]
MSETTLKKRNEIERAHIWSTEDLYQSDAIWEKECGEVIRMASKVTAYKGKLNNPDKLLEYLDFTSALEVKLEKLGVYAYMRSDEDVSDGKYSAMKGKILTVETDYCELNAFFTPEVSAIDTAILTSWANEERFSDYSYLLTEIIRRKKYSLSEKEERILALSYGVTPSFKEIFGKIDNVEIPFPKIKMPDGKKAQLTHGLYSVCLHHPDRELRKRAFDALYRTYRDFINTICSTYHGSVKADNFYAKVRGYKSALDKAMYNDNVPTVVYENLIKAVSANLGNMHEYMALRKSVMGVDKLHMYDLYTPIASEVDKTYDFEEAFAKVVDGLSPLGLEYHELLMRAKNERWMDVYETKNKRSGAYSTHAYGYHPFVLLNHKGTLHDVFTIAHELGHAIHSHYSNQTQPYAKSQYSIFVAEVASTVNEVLLLKSMLANATDKSERIYLLSYYLDCFRTTLFRQTMFAEFEKIAHEIGASGKPFTPTVLSNKYYALNKKYYGPSVTHDDKIRYEWARIPHFYSAFYVYKYATGLTSAVSIANAILSGKENALENYIKFLSAGGSDSPYEILKIAGVDLGVDEPFNIAMQEFCQTLNMLKEELK